MPAISLHWPAHKPCRLCYYTQLMTLSDITTREVCGKAMGFQEIMFVLRLPKLRPKKKVMQFTAGVAFTLRVTNDIIFPLWN